MAELLTDHILHANLIDYMDLFDLERLSKFTQIAVREIYMAHYPDLPWLKVPRHGEFYHLELFANPDEVRTQLDVELVLEALER